MVAKSDLTKAYLLADMMVDYLEFHSAQLLVDLLDCSMAVCLAVVKVMMTVVKRVERLVDLRVHLRAEMLDVMLMVYSWVDKMVVK